MRGPLTIAATALALTFTAIGIQAQDHTPTDNADGTVALVVDDRQFLVPATVAEDVVAAVRAHADDPQALQQAIRAIVAQHAGCPQHSTVATAIAAEQPRCPEDVALATAIATLAIHHAHGRSASVDAIVRGAAEGNPKLSAGAVLAALPATVLNPRAQDVAERQIAQLQATAENPSQISPVE